MASKSLRTLIRTTKGHTMATGFERLSERTQGAQGLVGASQRKAAELGLHVINNTVILLTMLDDEESVGARVLTSFDPHIGALLMHRVERDLQDPETTEQIQSKFGPQPTRDAYNAFDGAYYEAMQTRSNHKDPEHILLSILRHDVSFQRWLMSVKMIDYIEVYTKLKSELLALQPA